MEDNQISIEFLQGVIVTLQVPILVFLFILSYQVYKSLKKKEFLLIALAWVFSSVYIMFSFLKLSKIIQEGFLSRFTISFCDIVSSFLFFIAALWFRYRESDRESIYKVMRSRGKLLAPLIVVFLGILSAKLFFPINKPVTESISFDVWSVPITIFSTAILIYLSSSFRYDDSESSKSRALKYGFFLYGILQILAVFIIKDINHYYVILGFSLGAAFKSVILYGTHKIFVYDAETKTNAVAFSERLNSILGRTFHEITAPLKTIKNRLAELENNNDKYGVPKRAVAQLEIIENNYNRVIAVISASMKVYEEGARTELYHIITDNTIAPNNINTLIEIAIISIKENAPDEEAITIQREYAKQCNILCYSNEITQVLYNLMKNSVDSFENEKGKLFIRTKVVKKVENEKTYRFVRVEIGDDGPGISHEIKESIFEEGISSKESFGHGFGLSIVKDLVEKNNGTIEIQSPYDFNVFDTRVNSGTLCVLLFEVI